jgi:hypothetical protein
MRCSTQLRRLMMPDPVGGPEETVRTYLRLMEARDLEAAATHLADDVRIIFPGGRTFTSLAQQVASSAGRFRGVTKTFDRFDVASAADHHVVYVFGTLGGEALDGSTFEGVRFIDRFVLQDGMIVSQMVWNDLAESGVLSR